MSEINVTVNGNVATEPKHVIGASGKPRTTFRLASTARKRQPDGSYADGATSFLNVTCFDTLALNTAASVHVGQPVVVTGTLTVRDWESGERTGSDADLVVRTVGHDLRWGRASFVKPERARAVEAAPGSGPEAVGGPSVPPSDREVPVGELRHESAA